MASDCWLWAGSKDSNGYGHLYIRGSGYGATPAQAHRVVYEALVGEIPAGMQLDHLCRVPACVNPEHLEPVTPKENVLRGVGISAQHARRTHCPKGHEFDQVNRNKEKTVRRCGTCHRDAERERRMKLSQVNS